MMGNWSFGDYYKKETITWAWELLTGIWGMDKSRLYATVYTKDDESYNIWSSCTDIDKSHIMRFGDKDNFWEMGDTGPCGYNSEIHYDLFPQKKEKAVPNADDGRVVEIWNLVFIQYNRTKDGRLKELDQKFVDTGAGFERIVAILQNTNSNYLTDLFEPVLKTIQDICGKPYNEDEGGMPFRVVADHARALAFSLCDDVIPSNEGRGYVMRRILRRAYRYGRNLGIKEPFLYRMVETVIQNFGGFYPEMESRKKFILEMVKSEEELFEKTLDTGLKHIKAAIDSCKKKKNRNIPGKEAFVLYDTYGFPLDLTRIIAEENDMSVDKVGFDEAMARQKKRSQEGAKFKAKDVIDLTKWSTVSQGRDSDFIGYEWLECNVQIRQYLLEKGVIFLTLDKTPFFAESGGQVADQGVLKSEECSIELSGVFKEGEHVIHKGALKGELPENGKLAAFVSKESRSLTCKNHTATHLLQAALRRTIGDHVKQSGSMVKPDSFRFDFNHFKGLTSEQILAVEEQVNSWIQQNLGVNAAKMGFDESQKTGALAFFGEKYGDEVRVVEVDNISRELCGGTHVQATGEIGYFVITSESSVASGVRRIEALTGTAAWEYIQKERRELHELCDLIEANNKPAVLRVREILDEKKNTETELKKLKSKALGDLAAEVMSGTVNINDIDVSLGKAGDLGKYEFTMLAEKIQDRNRGLAVLFGNMEGKGSIIVLAGKEALEKGVNAGNIVKELAVLMGGRGGGKPERAQAGGPAIKEPAKLNGDIKRKLEELLG
jgi:alanyl-tRNA synthetase